MYTIFLVFLTIMLLIIGVLVVLTLIVWSIHYWDHILSGDYFYDKRNNKLLINIIREKRKKINEEMTSKIEINEELYGKYLALDEIIKEFNIKEE
jgi:hypothetical protein